MIAEINVRVLSFVVDVSDAAACAALGIRGWTLRAWATSAGEMLTDFIPASALTGCLFCINSATLVGKRLLYEVAPKTREQDTTGKATRFGSFS